MKTQFDDFIDKPNEGDWVMCDRGPGRPEINNYIKNTIGRIININPYSSDQVYDKYYVVKFFDIPQNIIDFFNFVGMSTNGKWEGCRDIIAKDIIYWSKNKEDVEEQLDAKKYNL